MPQPTDLIPAAWLAQHLHDPNLVIVDCRFALTDSALGQQQYQQGHIPGAVYLDLNRDLSSPVQEHGGRHPLPDLDNFVHTLQGIGVSSDRAAGPTLVVAYDDSGFAFASRLWWLLKYLGHDAVGVLDGGWSGWQRQGYATTPEPATPTPGHFIPRPRPEWTVAIDYVRHHKDDPGVRLIDSRSPERYRGEVEPIDPVAGSIPGAENYFWQAVSDASGQMKSPAKLAQHWASLEPEDEVIVYCGSGVTACVNALSQVIAGKPLPKLYVGGWSDWCSYR